MALFYWIQQDTTILSCINATIPIDILETDLGSSTSIALDSWFAIEKHLFNQASSFYLQLKLQLQP